MPLDKFKHSDPNSDLEVTGIRISKFGGTVKGLADPVSNQDAATKKYVDTAIQQLTSNNAVHPFLLMGA